MSIRVHSKRKAEARKQKQQQQQQEANRKRQEAARAKKEAQRQRKLKQQQAKEQAAAAKRGDSAQGAKAAHQAKLEAERIVRCRTKHCFVIFLCFHQHILTAHSACKKLNNKK